MPNRRFILAHGFSPGSLGSVALEPVTRQDTIEKVCLQEGSQKGTRETGRAGFPTTPSRHAPSGRYLLRVPQPGDQTFITWAFGGHFEIQATACHLVSL